MFNLTGRIHGAVLVSAGLLACAQAGFAQGRAPQWHVDPAPAVRIGTEGDPNVEFQRIAGALRLSSGDVIVADGGTQELRRYTSDGRFVRRIARRGKGPGEQSYMTLLARAGDSMFVFDGAFGPSQMSRYAPDGSFIDRMYLRAAGADGGVTALGRLANGRLLVRSGGIRVVTPGPLHTLWRDSSAIGVMTIGDPGTVDRIGMLPNMTWTSYPLVGVAAKTTMTAFPFGPRTLTAVVDDVVWIGDTGSGQLTAFDAGGSKIRTIGAPVPPRALDAAAVRTVRARALEGARDVNDSARIAAMYDDAVRPRIAPRFDRLVPSRTGELIVQLYEEHLAQPHRFIALDRTGVVTGTFAMPHNVSVHEVGADYVLGVETDDDGIERVVIYRLRR